jgi:hypothetical protein
VATVATAATVEPEPAATSPRALRSSKGIPQVEISLRHRTEEELATYRRLSQVTTSSAGGGGRGQEVSRGRTLTPKRSGEVRVPRLRSSRSAELREKWDGKVKDASRDVREMDRLQLKLDRLTVGRSQQPEGSRDGRREGRSPYLASGKVE